MASTAHGSPAGAAQPPRGRRNAVLLIAGHPTTDADRLEDVGDALAAALPAGWSVSTVVRSSPTAIADAVRSVAVQEVEDLVVVPLHPQFIPTVTGAILRDLYGALRRHALHMGLTVRIGWHDDAGYVQALARGLADHVTERGVDPATTYLRFETPPQAPEDEAEAGPYRRHIRRTAELVVERVGWPADRWLLQAAGTAPAAGSADRVIVATLPFPEDGNTAGSAAPSALVEVLRHIVLHGSQAANGNGRDAAPLLPARPLVSPEKRMALVMIGASLANGLGHGRGPALRYSDPRAFAVVRRSRKALRACLDYAREQTPLVEAFVWNTCQRIELYGWLPPDTSVGERTRIEEGIRHALYGAEPEGLEINVLSGAEACHHVMRTACGLNSGLPGDRDVSAQLQTAGRMSQCAGSGGPRTASLVEAAVALARDVHAGTAWGRFSTGYCAAALTRVCEVDGVRLDRFTHVVIGGSTTSRSILTTLSEEHGVPHRQMTLVHRDHHGQMRQLRAALGTGRRVRVHAYDEEPVVQAIADADFVFFGIDQADPVLDAALLRDLRDVSARPLTLVDFNQFGSIRNPDGLGPITLWSAKELDEAVAAHAAVTITQSGFAEALTEAEAWILERLPAARHSVVGTSACPCSTPSRSATA